MHATTNNGDSISYTFTGGVDYITETYTDEGNVSVYIDGTNVKSVSASSAQSAGGTFYRYFILLKWVNAGCSFRSRSCGRPVGIDVYLGEDAWIHLE